jgi:putative hydroxymethylpyrimidine transport system permease protein
MRDTARAARQQPPAAQGQEPAAQGQEPAAQGQEPAAQRQEPAAQRQEPAAAGLAGRPPWARSLLRRCWPPALIILAGLGLWELIVRLAHVPGYLVPAPSAIAADLAADWPVLEPALLVTVQEVLLGFVIAAVAGVGLAVALHLSPVARRAVYPLILLGYGIGPKLVIVALVCFFPIVVNGIDGLRSVDAELILMMRTLDASRWAILRRVEFPAALPSIFSGLRIAATFAAIGAVFGEWSGSSQGLGYVMLAATPNLLTARIFAAIVLLTAVALVLFGVVSLLERIFVPWAPRGGSERKDPP